MWEHPATRANAELLRSRGVEFVGPAEGELAEGESRRREDGRAGGDRRGRRTDRDRRLWPPLGRIPGADAASSSRPVGHASRSTPCASSANRSSGRMGVALAEEARRRGAEVTLLAANLGVAAPRGVTVVDTPTASDLEREALARSDADVIVMAAAVADYRPAAPGAREASEERRAVDRRADPDRRRARGSRRQSPTRSGHRRIRRRRLRIRSRASTGEAAREGLRSRRLQRRVETDIGFDADHNEVVLLRNGSEQHVPRAPKSEIAAVVLDEVERIVAERSSES